MNVSLPASQKDYVRLKAAASGCSTPSEYVRRLIHADQQAHQAEELELKLLEGLDSPVREMNSKDLAKLRRTLRARVSRKRRAR